MSQQAIKDALHNHGPMTSKQIGGVVDLSASAVSRYLKKMKDTGVIYISDHNRCARGGHHPPIYAIGDAPHAKPPPRSTKPRKPQVRIPRAAVTRIQRTQSAGMWGGLMS